MLNEGLGRLDYAKPIVDCKEKAVALRSRTPVDVEQFLGGGRDRSVVLSCGLRLDSMDVGKTTVQREISALKRLKRRLRNGAKEGWNSCR
jgi:hypothetical protein